jgi:hypothetical protein
LSLIYYVWTPASFTKQADRATTAQQSLFPSRRYLLGVERTLKGTDMSLYAVFRQLGLEVDLVPIIISSKYLPNEDYSDDDRGSQASA